MISICSLLFTCAYPVIHANHFQSQLTHSKDALNTKNTQEGIYLFIILCTETFPDFFAIFQYHTFFFFFFYMYLWPKCCYLYFVSAHLCRSVYFSCCCHRILYVMNSKAAWQKTILNTESTRVSGAFSRTSWPYSADGAARTRGACVEDFFLSILYICLCVYKAWYILPIIWQVFYFQVLD